MRFPNHNTQRKIHRNIKNALFFVVYLDKNDQISLSVLIEILLIYTYSIHVLVYWSFVSGYEDSRYVRSNRISGHAFMWWHSAKSSKSPSAPTGITRRNGNCRPMFTTGWALETVEECTPVLWMTHCPQWQQNTLSFSNPSWAALGYGRGKGILYILRISLCGIAICTLLTHDTFENS